MEREHHKNKTVKNFLKRRDRKPYVKPELIEYGQIEKLTESGGTRNNDGGGPQSWTRP